MPIEVVPVKEFLSQITIHGLPVIDTRSEAEFTHASIPGSVNLPLLNNEERIIVGTIYKQSGKEEAVSKGFELVGPRFHEFIKQALVISPAKEVFMYCWRGGMRSNIMAWILSMADFKVTLLEGGYKSFRNFALETCITPKNVIVLGGPTGSGKTEILNRLSSEGEQVLDLEGLANHKGSAFGGLGQPAQPSNEHFENLIALQWDQFDSHRPVWVENESRSIGSCMIPEGVFFQLRDSIVINISVPYEQRMKRIEIEYGQFPVDVLATTSKKIEKRLGPQHLKLALEHLYDGNFREWLNIILNYYDKLYNFGNEQRLPEKIHHLNLTGNNVNEYTSILKTTARKLIQIDVPLNTL